MLENLVCDRIHTVRCPPIPLHSILITLDFPLFHTVAPLPNAEPQSAQTRNLKPFFLSGLKRRQHELGIKLTPAENVSKERPGRGWSASPCVDIVGCIEGILIREFRTPHGAQSWPPPPIAPDRRSTVRSIRGELVSINPSVVLLSVAARNSAPETFTSKLLQRWGRRCTGCVG